MNYIVKSTDEDIEILGIKIQSYCDCCDYPCLNVHLVMWFKI